MSRTARFEICGLEVVMSSDHPELLGALTEDLQFFRKRRRTTTATGKPVHLRITALPADYAATCPPPFDRYRHLGFPWQVDDRGRSMATSFGVSAITVLEDVHARRIEAGIVPHPSLLPDPAYHACFTQPVSLFLKQRGYFFVHGGCVAENDRGVLIVGESRAGKSTLSISAVRGGFQFVGDEQPLLSDRDKRGVRVHAFPRRVRMYRKLRTLFPELRDAGTPLSDDRILLDMDRTWPGCVVPSCHAAVLVFPAFQQRGALRVQPLGRPEALTRLLRDEHFKWYPDKRLARISQKHLDLFERLGKQTRAFEVHYGWRDIPRIPDLFRELLGP